MKKVIIPFVIFLLIVLAIISPWDYLRDLLFKSFGLSSSSVASISISSKVGNAKVYLNDEEVGETPFEKNDLKPGTYTIRLEKITDTEGFYTNFERAIEVEEGTQIVVNWEIGPSEEFSSGEIYFFKEQLDSNEEKSTISVIANPEDAGVYFNGALQKGEPAMINDVEEGEHKLKIEKEGYITEDLDISTKKGYDLFVEVQLFPIPVDIEL